jgi:AraC family transcriptional regulator, mar-sox-rob regulon activator
MNAFLSHFPAPATFQAVIASRCEPPADRPRTFVARSRTTDRVFQLLLRRNLHGLSAALVAAELGMSCTTMRRRLRADRTSYQLLLDRARQYRCEHLLRRRWLPGKCLADRLGYTEVNSFYRAFRRWTGTNFRDYKAGR